MTERRGHRPGRAAERHRLRRVRRRRRLVGAPAPLRAVRAHRLLRLLAGPARERARGRDRPPDRAELRAGRGLVLGLRERGLLRRPGARRPAAPPGRPDRARAARPACRPTGVPRCTERCSGAVAAAARQGPELVGRAAPRVRAAVVVPVNFAIGSQLIGNAQVATFAAFGSFALLLFVNFPGTRAARARRVRRARRRRGRADLARHPGRDARTGWPWWRWRVVAFARAVRGRAQLGGQRRHVGRAADVHPGRDAARACAPICRERLAGWGIAFAVAVPVALFVWPPQRPERAAQPQPPRCAARWRRCCTSSSRAPGDRRPARGDAARGAANCGRRSAPRPRARPR